MKTILIDLDDVLTCDNIIKVVSDYLGYEIHYEDVDGYYIQDILGDKKEEFFKKIRNINLYENASLTLGSYDSLKRLSEKYNIYICSAYIWKEMTDACGKVLKDKYDFLYKNLDFIDPNNFIFSCDKSIINTDIKIDDKLENLKNAKIKLLYTAYHNKNISNETLKKENVIRVNNFKEIEKILLNDLNC